MGFIHRDSQGNFRKIVSVKEKMKGLSNLIKYIETAINNIIPKQYYKYLYKQFVIVIIIFGSFIFTKCLQTKYSIHLIVGPLAVSRCQELHNVITCHKFLVSATQSKISNIIHYYLMRLLLWAKCKSQQIININI